MGVAEGVLLRPAVWRWLARRWRSASCWTSRATTSTSSSRYAFLPTLCQSRRGLAPAGSHAARAGRQVRTPRGVSAGPARLHPVGGVGGGVCGLAVSGGWVGCVPRWWRAQNETEATKMEAKEEKAREIEKDNIKAKSKMTKVRIHALALACAKALRRSRHAWQGTWFGGKEGEGQGEKRHCSKRRPALLPHAGPPSKAACHSEEKRSHYRCWPANSSTGLSLSEGPHNTRTRCALRSRCSVLFCLGTAPLFACHRERACGLAAAHDAVKRRQD